MLYAAVYSMNTPKDNYEIYTFVFLKYIASCEVIKIRNTVSISFWYHICAFVSWCNSCCVRYNFFIVLCEDIGIIFRWRIVVVYVPNRPVIDSNVTLLVLTSFSKLPAGPKVSAINYIHMLHMPLWKLIQREKRYHMHLYLKRLMVIECDWIDCSAHLIMIDNLYMFIWNRRCFVFGDQFNQVFIIIMTSP